MYFAAFGVISDDNLLILQILVFVIVPSYVYCTVPLRKLKFLGND